MFLSAFIITAVFPDVYIYLNSAANLHDLQRSFCSVENHLAILFVIVRTAFCYARCSEYNEHDRQSHGYHPRSDIAAVEVIKENKAVAVKIQFLSPRRARRIKHKTAEQFDNDHESNKNLFL